MVSKNKKRRSKKDMGFDLLVDIILLSVFFVTLIPVLYVISVSMTPYSELLKRGGFVLIPSKITGNAYKEILSDGKLLNSIWVTIRVTVFGTLGNVAVTMLMAYPLSRFDLPGRSIITRCVVFTMLFSGGTIPTYLVVKQTGLLDSLWALMIPGLVSVHNLIIMKAFFEGLPEELFDAARLDGCNEFQVVWKLVLPMSVPILLTIGMYYMVTHWNAYMTGILYITNEKLQPMQVVLRRILVEAKNDMLADEVLPTETLRMAAVCITTAPIIVVYPFIQKYFVKGTLAGAVKG